MAEHTTARPRDGVAGQPRDSEDRTSPAVVEALARAHQALLQDLRRLEDTARAAAGATLAEARAWLVAVRAHLADHFRFEEEDGYLDAVRKREPRLERAAEQLAEEHRSLMRDLDALLKAAAEATRLDDGLREGLRRWVKEVRKHEARENDLVQEAFAQDIGTKD
jgi:hemerythrin